MDNYPRDYEPNEIEALFAMSTFFTVVATTGIMIARASNPSVTDVPMWDVIKYVIIVGGAVYTARRAFNTWRLQNMTERWYTLMEYLHEHPEYMDPERNADYRQEYSDPEQQWQYESIARMCIAYVDDVYFLRSRKNFDDWLVGTIPLLVGRHSAWFRDNTDAYDRRFVEYVEQVLRQQGI